MSIFHCTGSLSASHPTAVWIADTVRRSVRAAFEAGTDGVVLAREYVEMWLANLCAAGEPPGQVFGSRSLLARRCLPATPVNVMSPYCWSVQHIHGTHFFFCAAGFRYVQMGLAADHQSAINHRNVYTVERRAVRGNVPGDAHDHFVAGAKFPEPPQAGGSHTPGRRPRHHTRAAGGDLVPSYQVAPMAPMAVCMVNLYLHLERLLRR